MSKRKSAWSPQAGPQNDAILATWCDEVFFGGARGGGKSDYLLGDFLQDVPKFGRHWQGVLFRRTYNELQSLVQRSQGFYPLTGAVWHEGAREWRWPNGAKLRMRYLERLDDATRYQGHSYTWIGFDELPQWADPSMYDMMKGCLRWAEAEIPTKRIRSSGNPGGAGHAWIKDRFIDFAPGGYQPFVDPVSKRRRMFIPSRVEDNKILMERDPGYVDTLKSVGSPQLVKAWLEGDWNVVTGAYFPEFSHSRHVIEPFSIPEGWVRFRCMDWGFASPFWVGWVAVSDGEGDYPRNSLVVYREWYGAKSPTEGLRLNASQVARGILEREVLGENVAYSVIDPSAFKQDSGPSIAETLAMDGVRFRRGDNTRVAGWNQIRERLVGDGEVPMLYVFNTCSELIRSITTLQHDIKKPEDCDTTGDDHAPDGLRYGIMSRASSGVREKVEAPRFMDSMTFNELWDHGNLGSKPKSRRIY
jgi:hypothetical protein